MHRKNHTFYEFIDPVNSIQVINHHKFLHMPSIFFFCCCCFCFVFVFLQESIAPDKKGHQENIFFLFFHENIMLWCSSEASHQKYVVVLIRSASVRHF